MRNRKQLKPIAKRSISTWPHVASLRELLRDCEQKGMTVAARLRQILDEYYSNERLKSFGRDVAESPIRRLQKEAVSEELLPLKSKISEIENGILATRSILEDILGRVAQMSFGASGVSPEISGEHVARLESVVDRLDSRLRQLSNGDEAERKDAPECLSLRAGLLKELTDIKALTAKLVLRALKDTVRAAVQAELKSGHNIHVQWTTEKGLEIYAVLKVVEKVRNPEIEITLNDARRRCGAKVQLGSEVWIRVLDRVDSVRIIAQAANQFLQREEASR